MNTEEPEPGVVCGLIVPGIPHPLLCPEAHSGYRKLAEAFREARQAIEAAEADLIV